MSPFLSHLGGRLALMLAFALLPLGLVASLQSTALSREARARAEDTVLGATRRATTEELIAMERATGVTETLARILAPAGPVTPERCNDILRTLGRDSALFSFIVQYDVNGRFMCSSQGDLGDRPFAEGARQFLGAETRLAGMLLDAPFSGEDVLFIQHPIRDATGRVAAHVAVSVPYSKVNATPPRIGNATADDLILFDRTGRILSTQQDLEEVGQSLPGGVTLADLVGHPERVFLDETAAGKSAIFALVPLSLGQYYALSIWPRSAVPELGAAHAAGPILLPLAMWIVSLVIALFAAERLVVRHVRTLNRAIDEFGENRNAPLPAGLTRAPQELRSLAAAFERMAETIRTEEAELETALAEKEVLLREVHHRVKNNLQLIASIMNLKMRRARTAESRALLQRLQARVTSLADVHRLLYQSSSLAMIRLDELVHGIVRQLSGMFADPERRVELVEDLAPVTLDPEQAVPVALFVTEALTNAFKYAGSPSDRPPQVSIALRQTSDGRIEVELANSVVGDDDPEAPSFDGGLGGQLLDAFATQLDGELVKDVSEGTYRVTLVFRPRNVADDSTSDTRDDPVPAS
ncbi:two-component sensor histidine kinase [Albidovulum inexpectatum]|uniref:histidine kinase n=1 Tax=Albidovulum inexpectatum TaxID=196587 RepID=A0A2S5JIT7_9RHOB|nr:sensor histidine kinase [Albidovulum inexpectatum]PPB81165.1 two-component sensor histidine kinase [Albidovulum inexpectatum]